MSRHAVAAQRIQRPLPYETLTPTEAELAATVTKTSLMLPIVLEAIATVADQLESKREEAGREWRTSVDRRADAQDEGGEQRHQRSEEEEEAVRDKGAEESKTRLHQPVSKSAVRKKHGKRTIKAPIKTSQEAAMEKRPR